MRPASVWLISGDRVPNGQDIRREKVFTCSPEHDAPRCQSARAGGVALGPAGAVRGRRAREFSTPCRHPAAARETVERIRSAGSRLLYAWKDLNRLLDSLR